MRRMMILVILAAAAGCGDEASTPGGESDMREPVTYKECDALDELDTMAKLEAFAKSGCESTPFVYVFGPEITSLEPLRGLRKVDRLWIADTNVRTLEPLRDLADVTTDVTFNRNASLSNCEVTGWIADTKKRDPSGGFAVTLDEGLSPTQCPTWAYPER